MSLQTSSIVLIVIMSIGFCAAIYFLIKDRVGIIRSIKPNSLADFFGLGDNSDFIDSAMLISVLNVFGLFIWVPFWILDKLFKLNIFEKNNKK
ncbi:MAG: hypothetical protein JXR05_12720 [Flavobacteriaceae bacterium]